METDSHLCFFFFFSSIDVCVFNATRDKVVSLAQLKDPRTKKSIQEVFGLNYPFEEYEGTDAVLK